jgi:hypothetical protein
MPADWKAVRGQVNDTPQPKPPVLIMWPIMLAQYTTTRMSLDGVANKMEYEMPQRLEIQLDFYGFEAGNQAAIAMTLFRSMATEGFFPEGVAPLYCTDARQFPLTTGEKQYEDRWSLTLALQYNKPVLVSQESFNSPGDLTIIPVPGNLPI